MKRNATRLFLFLAVMPFLTSCATVFQGSRTDLTVTSPTPGAQVFYRGEKVGDGTATVKVKRKDDQQFEVRAEGYQSATVNFNNKMQAGFIVLDALLTGILGIIIDAATGAWNKFDQQVKTVELTPKSGGNN